MALKRPEARRIHPVILSGGAGTRLWPLSRGPSYPKQFIPLLGQGSLLRQTLERVADRSRFAEPLILSGKEHRFQVGEALREAGQEAVATVLEPVPRNTGPASCVAALMVAARAPSALMLLLPSDHHIADPAGFRHALDQAADAALGEWIVALGVIPDRPFYAIRAVPARLRRGFDGCGPIQPESEPRRTENRSRIEEPV